MFFQYTTNIVFSILVITFIPLESFSKPQSKNLKAKQEVTQGEQDVESPEDKYSRIFTEIFKLTEEMIKESSWFKSDSPMSDHFITTLLFEYLQFPRIAGSMAGAGVILDPDYLNELKIQIKPAIERITKQDIGNAMYKKQRAALTLILKNETSNKEDLVKKDFIFLTIPKQYIIGKNVPEMINVITEQIKTYKVKKIGVNAFEEIDFNFMIALSKVFKENQINVEVLGFCNGDCARNLLLSAKSVSIGPYGLISYNNFFPASYEEALQAFKNEEEDYKNKLEATGGVDNYLKGFFVDSKNRDSLRNSILGKEKYRQILLKIENNLGDIGRESSDPTLISNLISSLSEGEKEVLHNLSYDLWNPDGVTIKEKQDTIKIMGDLSKKTEDFFNSLGEVKSDLDYSIFDFFNLASDISKPFVILQTMYPNYTRKYQSSGVEQPVAVVPSVDILKNLGLTITKGTNHSSKLKEKEKKEKKDSKPFIFLNLDADQINKCGFFKENKETLDTKECLTDLLKKR